MYHIPGVLSPQDVARFREQLEQAEWVDGRVTTGAQGAQVKNNQQVDTRSTLYAALQNEVLNAVNQHALFFAAALPRTLSTPLFNRYQNNETYGFHVDGAVRSHPQNGWMRTDLSATLVFVNLSPADNEYISARQEWLPDGPAGWGHRTLHIHPGFRRAEFHPERGQSHLQLYC